MMSKKEWATKEIELAKNRERDAASKYEWDYKCACYDSALKAFTSLIEDDHSGMSIKITKTILNRLIDTMPLVPIEDTEDIWDTSWIDGTVDYISYRCKRMSSLFKHVYKDGTIKFYDNDYCQSISINNSEFAYHSSLISNIIHDISDHNAIFPYFTKESIL